MGARSRRKGHDWERTVAAMLEEATGVRCVRCLTEVRDGLVGDITTDLPLSVQCKVGQAPNLWRALSEAVEAAADGEYPVAVMRRNASGARGRVDVAAMPLEAFLRLLRAALDTLETDGADNGTD